MLTGFRSSANFILRTCLPVSASTLCVSLNRSMDSSFHDSVVLTFLQVWGGIDDAPTQLAPTTAPTGAICSSGSRMLHPLAPSGPRILHDWIPSSPFPLCEQTHEPDDGCLTQERGSDRTLSCHRRASSISHGHQFSWTRTHLPSYWDTRQLQHAQDVSLVRHGVSVSCSTGERM